MNEIVNKVEQNYLLEQMQNSKNVENEHTTKIMTIFTKIDNNRDDFDKLRKEHDDKLQELDKQYTQLFTNFETTGSNMSKEMENIQKLQKEREMKDGVEQTIEKLISNVEIIFEKEKLANQIEKKFENKLNKNINTSNKQINDVKNLVDKVKSDLKKQINKINTNDLEVSNSIDQMLNNIEFEHIYDLLKSGNIVVKQQEQLQNKNIDDKKESFNEKYS